MFVRKKNKRNDNKCFKSIIWGVYKKNVLKILPPSWNIGPFYQNHGN